MNRAEFAKCIDLLIETYGDRAYPQPRIERIWSWAKRASSANFQQAVDNAIGDSHQAPLLGKLKEYYAEIRAKNPGADKIPCDYCDGNGFILSADIMPTAYACNCETGQLVPEYVNRWNGPWLRMVPRPNEILRVPSAQLVNSTMKGIE